MTIIPRKRLRWIPSKFKAAHEYCFFLHDECVRALVEYEGAQAHDVSFKFKRPQDAPAFERLAKDNPIHAMRVLGYERQARKLVLNQVTMALVSDCLHHIYEALTCIERRKIVVAFNLLRKPLKDSLLMLSWMFGNEDGFYSAFASGNPELLSPKRIGNRRPMALNRCFKRPFTWLRWNMRSSARSLRISISYSSNTPIPISMKGSIAGCLMCCCTYRTSSWVCLIAFAPWDEGGMDAFYVRSTNGYALACDINTGTILADMKGWFGDRLICPKCKVPLNITRHNGLRILLGESIKCTWCGRVSPFPFSRLF